MAKQIKIAEAVVDFKADHLPSVSKGIQQIKRDLDATEQSAKRVDRAIGEAAQRHGYVNSQGQFAGAPGSDARRNATIADAAIRHGYSSAGGPFNASRALLDTGWEDRRGGGMIGGGMVGGSGGAKGIGLRDYGRAAMVGGLSGASEAAGVLATMAAVGGPAAVALGAVAASMAAITAMDAAGWFDQLAGEIDNFTQKSGMKWSTTDFSDRQERATKLFNETVAEKKERVASSLSALSLESIADPDQRRLAELRMNNATQEQIKEAQEDLARIAENKAKAAAKELAARQEASRKEEESQLLMETQNAEFMSEFATDPNADIRLRAMRDGDRTGNSALANRRRIAEEELRAFRDSEEADRMIREAGEQGIREGEQAYAQKRSRIDGVLGGLADRINELRNGPFAALGKLEEMGAGDSDIAAADRLIRDGMALDELKEERRRAIETANRQVEDAFGQPKRDRQFLGGPEEFLKALQSSILEDDAERRHKEAMKAREAAIEVTKQGTEAFIRFTHELANGPLLG